MRKLFIFILLCFSSTNSAARDEQFGIELDALPWLTGGYYLSGIYASGQLKYRAIAANINVPDSLVESGFQDKEITAYALIVDYFPDQHRQGIWYGAGLERWQSQITNSQDKSRSEYDNTVMTLGLGYVWQLTDSIYLNPWAALHNIVDGETDIKVGNKTYQQETLTASGSIKLGFSF